MADIPEAVARLIPHILDSELSLSAWEAVRPFLTHALATTRMQHILSDTYYISESGKRISAHCICEAAQVAIEVTVVGYGFQRQFVPSLLTDYVSPLMAWTIFLLQHVDDLVFTDAISGLWKSATDANRSLLTDVPFRQLIHSDAQHEEYLRTVFDFWTHIGIVDRTGPWLSVLCVLMSSWIPDPRDGTTYINNDSDALLDSAVKVVSSRADAIAHRQIQLLRRTNSGSGGHLGALLPTRLMNLLHRSREFRMALEARSGIRLLCKLLRRHSLDFAPSTVNESEISSRLESAINILTVLLHMLSGPGPSREALHCGALLTIMLLWSHIEQVIALRDINDSEKWLDITRKSCEQYLSAGIEQYMWFPSIHRTLERSIWEVDVVLEASIEVHERPRSAYQAMRRQYTLRQTYVQSIVQRCSNPLVGL